MEHKINRLITKLNFLEVTLSLWVP